jgi:hypothetical protein
MEEEGGDLFEWEKLSSGCIAVLHDTGFGIHTEFWESSFKAI